MEYEINIVKILNAVLKRKWVILLLGMLSLLLGFAFISGDGPDMYAASSTIYSASYVSYQESMQGMYIMRDYVDVIRSRKVAERACGYISQTISANEIMSMISANYASDSKIITITANSRDPERAVMVANAVADAFIQEIVSITAVESVKVLDSAYAARLVRNAQAEAMKTRVIFAVVVVVGAIVVFVLIAAFDTRVMFPSEVTLGGKIELLGIIPNKNI